MRSPKRPRRHGLKTDGTRRVYYIPGPYAVRVTADRAGGQAGRDREG
jgi:hypothetical protein